MTQRLIGIAFLLCAAVAAPAASRTELLAEPLRIPPGGTHTLTFDTVPQAGHTVLLELTCRLDTPGPCSPAAPSSLTSAAGEW